MFRLGKNLRPPFLSSMMALGLALVSFSSVLAADSKNADPASSPAHCGSQKVTIDGKPVMVTPSNCLFLEEPIGGKPHYDLYTAQCTEEVCTYRLWDGGIIPPGARGPLQAILTREAGKEYQGPFGLLYSYISLIYNYMSGLIIGLSVLFVVYGGIRMSTSGGDSKGYEEGISWIKRAITGIIVWFAASLILYTINPTFFSF